MQNIIMCAMLGKPYRQLLSERLLTLYSDDLDFHRLRVQLDMLGGCFRNSCENETVPETISFTDCIRWFISQKSLHSLLSEVKTVFKLLLMLPATNAVSERSFSTLRRLKSYLRSVMTQDRLNALMTLNIYKEWNDKIAPQTIIKLYVGDSERRAQRIEVHD